MAKFYDVNNIVASGAEAIYRLKEVLVDAGWTVPSSSDGTTYNSSGDQITSGSSGANGLNNASAWVRVRDPGGRRELIFQRATSTNEHQWRVTYSALSKFTTGSPSATVVPSGTDSQILLGAGTDGSPTYAQLFPSGGGYRFHAVAQSTAVDTNQYGFWAVSTNTPAGTCSTAIFLEPMNPNSYPVEDVDPIALRVAYSATLAMNISVNRAWYLYGLGGATFASITPTTGGGVINALIMNGYNSKMPMFPILYVVNSAPWYKGNAYYLKYKTVSTRAYPDTVDLTTDAYLIIDQHLMPWPESVSPIL